jgi:hypothetical protein
MRVRWLLLLLAGCSAPGPGAPSWKAGVAKATITPEELIWMSGYGSRTKPAEGKLHDLWAKALAIEDPAGAKAVVVTLDLCGIDRWMSERIVRAVGLGPESVLLACSHTHTGPMVGRNLECMFDLPGPERERIARYSAWLEGRVARAAREALAALRPARLEWGIGTAGFAVNRRNNPEAKVPELRAAGQLKGPVDHEVPVLRVSAAEGLLALLFGYACHNTTLSSYEWSGDYAGYAQIEVEKANPGATAFFFSGCGADQNPLPRRSAELAGKYGRELAEAAGRAPLRPLSGRLSARHSILELPFDTLPTNEELEKRRSDARVAERRRAEILLAEIREKGSLSPTYPYPIQIWKLGSELTLVSLGGEVVVDYSIRLKKELGAGRTWVAGYANDVMAYIPSRRVLDEGGYEGGGAMVYYGLPAKWGPAVEDLIVERVKRLASGP